MIRKAELRDAHACVEIMNQAIETRCNAFIEAFNETAGALWYDQLLQNSEVVLCCVFQGLVVAWGSLTPYRKGRGALSKVSEITFYVHTDFRRKGIALALAKQLETEAKAMNKSHLMAILLDDNAGSTALLKKLNYTSWGHLPAIADFGNEVKGQIYMGKEV
jgi:L-amino acid N-acyltransferase